MKIIKTAFKIISFILGILALMAGVNLVFTIFEDRKRRHAPENGKYYNWRYGKVFFHVRGSGAPVILLHGFEPYQSGKDLESLSGHLATNHTVYRIDLPGFGLSDKPWVTYTNYFYVLLIQDFIKDVIGEITDIVACGESGLCALQAYQDDPDMIGKVVLINPCYSDPVKKSGPFVLELKQLIDLPVIGTFLYNLYSLTSEAPFDKEGRHVFTSRMAGYLTSDLTGHDELFGYNVAILNKEGSEQDFTFGDVKTSLT